MSNHCPICNYRGNFRNYRGRVAAHCPQCASLERHRLVWLFWRDRTDLLDARPKRMLHMAPEPCFRQRLPRVPGLDYLTGDLNPKAARAMRKLNLTKLDLPSDHFDAVYASHILEHIHDDLAAMRELFRVTRSTGWAVLQVPLRLGEHTQYDPGLRTPQARKQAYGQHNHVRQYGELDYGPRLEEAGFRVAAIPFAADWGQDTVSRYGVCRHERIYLCTKS